MFKRKLEYKNGKRYVHLRVLKNLFPGQRIIYQNNEYIVIESKIKLVSRIIVTDIVMMKLNELKVDEVFNDEIRGTSIQARVIKLVEKDKKAMLQVDFDYGLSKKNKAKQMENKSYIDIYYKTFYSKTNTGFFPAPEVNDIVDVEFYSKDENDLKISWSIENENSNRFNDSNNRKYINNNIEINLSELEFNVFLSNKLNINSENININSKNALFKTNKLLALASDEDISLEANGDLELYAKEIKMESKKDDIKIFSGKNLLLKGDKIYND